MMLKIFHAKFPEVTDYLESFNKNNSALSQNKVRGGILDVVFLPLPALFLILLKRRFSCVLCLRKSSVKRSCIKKVGENRRKENTKWLYIDFSSFCPCEEEFRIGSLTNEMGRRVNCMCSTFKQFLLETWLMKRKLSLWKSIQRCWLLGCPVCCFEGRLGHCWCHNYIQPMLCSFWCSAEGLGEGFSSCGAGVACCRSVGGSISSEVLEVSSGWTRHSCVCSAS